ncbi:MAG: flagellar basal body protein [Candidatus Gastranaerophilales bacterium]|nr:flagellar basal body protein [Candidatus Gastranaerophilales bacterium]
MSFNSHNSIDKTKLILDVITKRQEAIGANITNVNTPGYVRQDVNFEQYIGSLNSPLETTLSKKIGPSPMMKTEGGEVNPAQELILMQKNALFYTLATRRITAAIQELKTIAQLGR